MMDEDDPNDLLWISGLLHHLLFNQNEPITVIPIRFARLVTEQLSGMF